MDALLVIDMQKGMFAIPGFVPHDGAAVVQRIGTLIGQARAHGIPVFFVQHDGGPGYEAHRSRKIDRQLCFQRDIRRN
jgi:nicotinamidase-related amidase